MTSPPRRVTVVVGELVGLTPDGAMIRSVQPDSSQAVVAWVLGANQLLEYSTGRHSSWLRGAVGGLLLGAATGALVGAGTYQEPSLLSRGATMGAAAELGGISGLIIGALFGSGRTFEGWRPVGNLPVRLGIAPTAKHGLRVTTMLGF